MFIVTLAAIATVAQAQIQQYSFIVSANKEPTGFSLEQSSTAYRLTLY
jgi:hypothetical protein